MAEEEQAGGGSADAAGVSLALTGASRAEADAYLRDQRHHLHEDLKQIGLRIWELRMGVLLRIATLMVGVAVASGLGLMVWDAAHSKGLVIEPFNVPPDLAGRGLTGDVIASQVIDKLTAMSKRESSRAVQSYANNWGDNIKVEIPETGVSIGELRSFLRDWLGHDIRITGEVYRSGDGIAVTARTSGGDEGATFTGRESDLDALEQQAAEHVYEVTQPYRYANYLDRNYDPRGLEQRVAKARAIYWKLIGGDDPRERAWAWNGLGTLAFRYEANDQKAIYYYRRAMAEVPGFLIATFAAAARAPGTMRDEDRYSLALRASRDLHENRDSDLNPHYAPYATLTADSEIAFYKGDMALSVRLERAGAALPDDFSVLARGSYIRALQVALIRGHDLAGLRADLRDRGWRELPPVSPQRAALAVEQQDWHGLIALESAMRRKIAASTGNGRKPGFADVASVNPALARAEEQISESTDIATKVNLQNFTYASPNLALAHAALGDFTGAERLVAPLPDYMDAGVQVRAQIAEMKGDHARADWWFARAEAMSPSIPFADTLWGQALLKRGQPDAAVEKFTLANKKGPKFADPLEGWGEALMAKNQSHLALAKFEEAGKYAPNWGRLHLKLGEALFYAGKHDEAHTQFVRAAQLDLTPSEKSELAHHP